MTMTSAAAGLLASGSLRLLANGQWVIFLYYKSPPEAHMTSIKRYFIDFLWDTALAHQLLQGNRSSAPSAYLV